MLHRVINLTSCRYAPARRSMSMVASVPYFRRHLIVLDTECDAASWPKKLENSDHVLAQFHRAIEPLNQAKDPKPLSLAAAYATHESNPPSNTSTHEVLVFPDNIRVSNIHTSDISFLATELVNETLDLNKISSRLNITPLDGHHIFVCAHAQRDFRCACAGPKLIEWFHEKKPDDWIIYACSHFGGHRFAGNCIVYPNGHWYGLVNSPEDVDTLIRAIDIENKPVVPELWRGCIDMPKELQIELHATKSTSA